MKLNIFILFALIFLGLAFFANGKKIQKYESDMDNSRITIYN